MENSSTGSIAGGGRGDDWRCKRAVVAALSLARRTTSSRSRPRRGASIVNGLVAVTLVQRNYHAERQSIGPNSAYLHADFARQVSPRDRQVHDVFKFIQCISSCARPGLTTRQRSRGFIFMASAFARRGRFCAGVNVTHPPRGSGDCPVRRARGPSPRTWPASR